jgi:hypothetical protein
MIQAAQNVSDWTALQKDWNIDKFFVLVAVAVTVCVHLSKLLSYLLKMGTLLPSQ